MNGIQIESSSIGTNQARDLAWSLAPVTSDLENRVLRETVRENLVSFPSQVPVFEKQSRPDLQQKIVVLYFIRGWKMDDIARRCGFGRQRVGQILTAWRIRAVKEGYLQAIEPEHPLFQRVRLEVPKTAPGPIAEDKSGGLETEGPQLVATGVTELRGSNLEEKLQAIVGVLDNQLRLCSRPINANIDSCGQLLTRAKALCARLETQCEAAHGNEERRITIIISAAKELFRRFQEHTVERPIIRPGRFSIRPATASK